MTAAHRRWFYDSTDNMGFCFKKNETVTKAIPRLGCQRARRALDCLKDCSQPEAIHGARKEIKKARAVLRLARENISKEEFRAIKRSLRKAASCLAKPRDAAVRANALRELTRRFKHALHPGAFRKNRVALRRASDQAMTRFAEKQNAKSAVEHLRRAAKEFRKLKIEANGWDVIAPGLERAYRECREAYQRAVKIGSAEAFHEWRKRAKYLWHHLALLEPTWPEKIDRMICELETVGDFLGEDHDLFILQHWLEGSKKAKGKSHQMKTLRQIIHKRQDELRGKALAMGKYFYTEKPPEFCRRLGGYWCSWERSGKPGRVRK
jgi:CHAD domain-containing protein